MKKLRLIIIWCLMLGTMAACGDKEEPTPSSESSKEDKGYIPLTAGTTWSYKFEGGTLPSYTTTVTGATKTINGKKYFEVEQKRDGDNSKGYILKEKGAYIAIGFVPALGDLELFMLKEETPLGKPWENTYTANGVLCTMSMTIEAKDLTKTVGGKTYKEVLHVRAVTSYSAFGLVLPTKTITDYYYAKNIGLILTDLGSHGKSVLVSYSIK